jgi:hypothetical protein
MSIGNAVQRGNVAYIYDEKGILTGQAALSVSGSPDDGLKGYTPSTVNVRVGNAIYSYDERLLRHPSHSI